MRSDGGTQPRWIPPQGRPDIKLPRLKVYNSLTRKKDDFVPVDPEGKVVTWYACGPTVYDDAHLGHAKNYASTDIIRRIMMDQLGFRVKFVMNTIDVDDKIILKGRQEHATDDNSVGASLLTEVKAAFRLYISKHLASLPTNTSPETFYEAVDKAYTKTE